eukprot:6507724-Pyramimonas_sp.AAC.1
MTRQELNLICRAFNRGSHQTAEDALLQHCKVPLAAACTALAVWTSPRHLSVAGQLAPPVWPTRGLPQGDALALATLCA